MDEENLFNVFNKGLINIIIIKIKNKENGITLYNLIEEQNISETFVFQFLKCVMNSIPNLLKNEKYVMLRKQGAAKKFEEYKYG